MDMVQLKRQVRTLFVKLSEQDITSARADRIPFSRVSINRGKYVKFSTFDGVVEYYGN